MVAGLAKNSLKLVRCRGAALQCDDEFRTDYVPLTIIRISTDNDGTRVAKVEI
jgi:hypothetical protein